MREAVGVGVHTVPSGHSGVGLIEGDADRVSVKVGWADRVVVGLAEGKGVSVAAGGVVGSIGRHSQPASSGRTTHPSYGCGHAPPHIFGATKPQGRGVTLAVREGVGVGTWVSVRVEVCVAIGLGVELGVG